MTQRLVRLGKARSKAVVRAPRLAGCDPLCHIENQPRQPEATPKPSRKGPENRLEAELTASLLPRCAGFTTRVFLPTGPCEDFVSLRGTHPSRPAEAVETQCECEVRSSGAWSVWPTRILIVRPSGSRYSSRMAWLVLGTTKLSCSSMFELGCSTPLVIDVLVSGTGVWLRPSSGFGGGRPRGRSDLLDGRLRPVGHGQGHGLRDGPREGQGGRKRGAGARSRAARRLRLPCDGSARC